MFLFVAPPQCKGHESHRNATQETHGQLTKTQTGSPRDPNPTAADWTKDCQSVSSKLQARQDGKPQNSKAIANMAKQIMMCLWQTIGLGAAQIACRGQEVKGRMGHNIVRMPTMP